MLSTKPLPATNGRGKQALEKSGDLFLNRRDFEQIAKSGAIELSNLYQFGLGRWRKAPGLDLAYEITTGTDAGEPVTFLKEWGEFDVLGYGTTLTVYDPEEDQYVIVKDDFTNAIVGGVPYADYFMTCNGFDGERAGYLEINLDYDTQTVNFTVGQFVSGANFRAKILADDDSGATGTLTLGIVEGRPVDDETITDPLGGSADVDGALFFTWTEGSQFVPKAGAIGIKDGNRLLLADTEFDRSETVYSAADKGSGVPFMSDDYFTQIIHYDTISVAYTVGAFINNEGLTGRILADNGTTELTVDHVIGSIEDNTPMTDTAGGSALANGLFALGPADSSFVSFKEAGVVKGLGKNGAQTVAIFDSGSLGFRVAQQNVDGIGLVLDAPIDYQNTDLGGTKGVYSSSRGIIFTNPFGIFAKQPTGFTDARFNMKDTNLTDVLSSDFLKNYNFEDSDITEDHIRELLIVNARDNATNNNVTLVYNFVFKNWATWDKSLNMFLSRGNEIFAGSSNSTEVFKFNFERADDNGTPYLSVLYLEWPLNKLSSISNNSNFILGARMADEDEVKVSYDLFDRKGKFLPRDNEFTLTAQKQSQSTASGVSIGGVSQDAVSGYDDSSSVLNYNLLRKRTPTKNFSRFRLRLENSSNFPLEYNFFALTPKSIGVVGINP